VLDGNSLGVKVGIIVGKFVGDNVGVFVGEVDGALVGDLVGDSVGGVDGLEVGKIEPLQLPHVILQFNCICSRSSVFEE